MLANLPQRVVRRIKRSIYKPHVSLRHPANMITMGTYYGGWTFIDHPNLYGGTIVSAGLGEDASFDTEFASRYGSKVVIVDPTPRALAHFDKIIARVGMGREIDYVPGGNQPTEAYDLSAVTAANLVLVPKALWSSETTVKFYEPPNPAHVSYSITNFQNAYSHDTPSIEVPTTTLRQILDEYGIESLKLIKLDIEGAQTEVLDHMLADGILPDQILVEFDDLSIPSRASREKYEVSDKALRRHGYECVYWNGRADFAYAHKRLLEKIGTS